MVTVLQIFFATGLVVLIILFVFRTKRDEPLSLPENYKEVLNDYVKFYQRLDGPGKETFEKNIYDYE